MTDPQAHYTQEEINEIIRRALSEPAARERALSHAELVEIAAEAGIERDALERATAELAQSRTQDQARQVARTSWRPSGGAAQAVRLIGGQLLLPESLPVLHRHSLHWRNLVHLAATGQRCPAGAAGAARDLPYDKVLRQRRREEKLRERERRRAARAAWKQKFFEGATPWHRERRNSRRRCNPGGGFAQDRHAQDWRPRRAPRETARPRTQAVNATQVAVASEIG